jgi:hypothetical protein
MAITKQRVGKCNSNPSPVIEGEFIEFEFTDEAGYVSSEYFFMKKGKDPVPPTPPTSYYYYGSGMIIGDLNT